MRKPLRIKPNHRKVITSLLAKRAKEAIKHPKRNIMPTKRKK